ncbi:BAG family molecular chaperone regulator 1-like [Malania oleifera]|uniref:BAG family molecular chaperone regulator 1-like n=1 Tax=Malania oleifera TaxID=397392 RepID=UPI0025AEBFA7|nr:BAG family molecular chaperone regulator 1-like [Malania oleifera]
MMQMKSKSVAVLSPAKGSSAVGGGGVNAVNWEVRPSGMVVQKRLSDSKPGSSSSVSTIKVKVKYGSSSYLEINITPQASFGELKKMLAGPTGVHPLDQKLIFKNKERDSKAYLDVAGVKEKSKIVLVEDIIARERRLLELHKTLKTEKASKAVKDISLEVDKLAGQVKSMELVVSRGGKVLEMDLLNLIELLMTQVIKLDEVVADGDVKQQRRFQVRRVQKYVETLDVLKIQNSMRSKNRGENEIQRNSTLQKPVVTTKWEKFDSNAANVPFSSIPTSKNSNLSWEFFE